MPSDEARSAAVALGEAAGGRPNADRTQKARVTAVNAGPPLSVDLLIEDTWAVPGVRYLASYVLPAVDDAVYVVTYGSGRRIVQGKEA